MARPVWHEAGNDPEAVADLLEKAAQDAAPLTAPFDVRWVPEGIDAATLHTAAFLVARRRIAENHGEQDRVIAQEVRAVDDLVKTANVLTERLREWFALYAPEATRSSDPARLASAVAADPDRAAVMEALQGVATVQASVGTDLEAADLVAVQSLATALESIQTSWRGIEARIADLMAEAAPNLAHVVGPILGARLIALAGNLERLAMWPASTVQTLGAETALFRHLKEKTLPPKHGILFQHPGVHRAPPWQRGAVARTLANLAVQAARADAFTHADLRGHLGGRMETELARIAAKPRPAPKPRGPGKGSHKGAQKGGPGGRPGKGGGPRGPQGPYKGKSGQPGKAGKAGKHGKSGRPGQGGRP